MLHVRAHPNASKSAAVGFTDGILQLKIAAPPVQGKANKELLAFLSKMLGISTSAISIEKGHTSRNKVLSISGLSQEEIIKRLFP